MHGKPCLISIFNNVCLLGCVLNEVISFQTISLKVNKIIQIDYMWIRERNSYRVLGMNYGD